MSVLYPTGQGWSYSAYSAALKCLRQFQYVFIDKLSSPQTGDLAFGSAIHSAVNASLSGEDGMATFEAYWLSFKGKELEYGRFSWGQLKDIGQSHVSKFDQFYKHRMTPTVMEQRYKAEYKGIALEGTVDFFGDLDGVLTMVDFKTSGYNYDKEKPLIALQLYLYTYLAIANGLPAPKQIAYFPFIKSKGSIQEPLLHPFSESEMHAHLDDMLAYIVKFSTEKNSLPKNPNSCIMGTMKCQFFNKCWKEQSNAESINSNS